MDIESLRTYCLRKKGKITESFPFGEDVLVFKVHGKIFMLARLDEHPPTVNLKCDPNRALELRERFASVKPGYHMNKKHWNTVILDGSIPDAEVRLMVDHAHELVVRGLPQVLSRRILGHSPAPGRRTSSR